MKQLIHGLTQGRVNPTAIERYFPNGCFVYHYEWDPKKIRCSRNCLPVFVKPVVTQYGGSHGSSATQMYICRANGQEASLLPYQNYYIADTFEDAMKEYRILIEAAYKARKEYMEQAIKDIDTHHQNTLLKVDRFRKGTCYPSYIPVDK